MVDVLSRSTDPHVVKHLRLFPWLVLSRGRRRNFEERVGAAVSSYVTCRIKYNPNNEAGASFATFWISCYNHLCLTRAQPDTAVGSSSWLSSSRHSLSQRLYRIVVEHVEKTGVAPPIEYVMAETGWSIASVKTTCCAVASSSRGLLPLYDVAGLCSDDPVEEAMRREERVLLLEELKLKKHEFLRYYLLGFSIDCLIRTHGRSRYWLSDRIHASLGTLKHRDALKFASGPHLPKRVPKDLPVDLLYYRALDEMARADPELARCIGRQNTHDATV